MLSVPLKVPAVGQGMCADSPSLQQPWPYANDTWVVRLTFTKSMSPVWGCCRTSALGCLTSWNSRIEDYQRSGLFNCQENKKKITRMFQDVHAFQVGQASRLDGWTPLFLDTTNACITSFSTLNPSPWINFWVAMWGSGIVQVLGTSVRLRK